MLVGGLSLLTFVGSAALGGGGAAQAAGATPKQVAAHVTFTPSPSPAYAADAADPNVLYSGGTYYAFTTGTAARQLHSGPDHDGQPRVGLAALYRWVGIERAAQPAVVGDAQYADLPRRLQLRRALGHVLRRLA